ncbi:cytochrome P450 [Bradyrhizobium sp. S69]|uniref:cytochrome P450 n=1 Tax=Bradyrhizobium sp. S69 TaxID=1641856 RepID=UPI00131CAF77|nr:cytochrome P450 [Bradyrhizobium sp. S69]
MSTAPHIDIDVAAFWNDPYPTLAALRKEAPIAYVPQLGSTLLCRRDDISVSEKQIDVFSSDQPNGLMTRLMGYNMMRKDGAAHSVERNAFFPAVSPRTVKNHWSLQFQAHADRLIDTLPSSVTMDFIADFALPFSAECLKSVTGLTKMRYQDMNAWSQAMIDGIANYVGDPKVEARCHEATAGIDAAIDDMLPSLEADDKSLLGVMVASGMPMDGVRANIKLAISGGQNEPRKALAGTLWALLTHPEQLDLVRAGAVSYLQAFEEFARWISPIGMSPRRIARPWTIRDVDFEPDDRAFLMFGSGNRDEQYFAGADRFDIRRDASKSIAFGAGPHFCAGAWVSRAMIANIALPTVLARLPNLRVVTDAPVEIGGWAFRGLLNLPLAWDAVLPRA